MPCHVCNGALNPSAPFCCQFTDEGDHLEVRVPIKVAGGQVSARDLSVDVQDDSLIVTFTQSERPVPLLVARPLYARIRPTETMW